MIKVYAHRGFSGRFPENTMLAFREAAKTGCHGIELDVQLTRDGQVVIIHDETLDRSTDGSGFVRDHSLAQLQQFNAAAAWHGAFGFQPIPTFEEYCRWVSGESLITNVEIKSGVYYYEELEEKTLELIRRYSLSDRIIFSSFNHSSVSLLRTLAPDIPGGALVEHEGLGNPGYYCAKNDFAYFHPGWKGLRKEDVDGCHAHGIGLNVWTVNDMDVLERLAEWGVDGIISNYPRTCLAYLRSLE